MRTPPNFKATEKGHPLSHFLILLYDEYPDGTAVKTMPTASAADLDFEVTAGKSVGCDRYKQPTELDQIPNKHQNAAMPILMLVPPS